MCVYIYRERESERERERERKSTEHQVRKSIIYIEIILFLTR